MKTINLLLSLPALFVHELSHVLAIILMGASGKGIEVNSVVEDFHITVHYATKSNFKKNVISIAPIIGFIIWSILIVTMTNGIFLGILLVYTMVYVRVFFPSDVDIRTYKTPIDNNDVIIPLNKKSE